MSLKPIRTVAVANRGEIARRIMRTCRSLGVRTVALFSDADEDMPFVWEADSAVRIGGPPSTESYLRADRVVEAAKRAGADAVHPGYGFLAENPDLARRVTEAGMAFIGPSAEVIEVMGSKRDAKGRARQADVPVVPGYEGADQDTSRFRDEARRVGFPVLLKASAGGGGKGMRIVRAEGELEDAIAAARREALGAFGDDTLLLEKYIESPRHVEIQILGDAHGKLVHLFERDCSVQRRYQKVVEESPAPGLDASVRTAMGEAAVRLGKAIGYENAGTVEFVLAPDGQFYFLEVNTRLQVEHPVTELVTGFDLVREQLRVAEGHPLAFSQEDLRLAGAAIECRLYAEDPDAGFLPQSGHIVDWHLPSLDGVRVDSGVETGSSVSIHYDPMLAKIIAHGDDRESARRRLLRALETLSVQGLKTNQGFLRRVLEDEDFVAGRIDTHFIERRLGEAPDVVPGEALEYAAIAAAIAGERARNEAKTVLRHVPSGFRNNPWGPSRVAFETENEPLELGYKVRGSAYEIEVGQRPRSVRLVSRIASGPQGWQLVLEEDGLRETVRVFADGSTWYVHWPPRSIVLMERPRFPDPSAELPVGACVAPMPGKIIAVKVAEGDAVQRGQVLVIMEAMKMEHSAVAPDEGVVERVCVSEGQQVDAEALLAVVS